MPKGRYARGQDGEKRERAHASKPGRAFALNGAVVTTPSHLSDLDAGVAKRMVELGITNKDIARVMGATPWAVKRALQRQKAAQTLYDGAETLAKNWLHAAKVAADDGRHEPAMAALQAIEAVDRPEAGGKAGGITVNVGVALPGTPGAPLCTVEGESRV